MPNIKPISDLRNYTEVLHDVAVGAPVFLTKNGRGRYAIVDGIKSYIAKNLENPSVAISTVRNITKDIRRLREHSLIGASLSSIADVESDYRFLVTGSYLTFYRVLDNDVYVDRVLYGRRDYLRILFGDVQDDETNE